MAVPSLTILVPTHNRPDVLKRVWPSWLLQQGIAQIVVVNDGSTVDYTSVLAELEAECAANGIDLKIINVDMRRGAPAARNLGLSACTSEEIFTTDDDLVLAPDLIERCRAQRPERLVPVIVGPRVIYLKDDETQARADVRSKEDQCAYFRPGDLTLVPWVDPGSVLRTPFVTALTLWPRQLFDRGLRYCEHYGGNGFREETDPQLQAQTLFGAEIYLTPAAKAFHLPPAIAYSHAGGQRRGGRLWFEYWVHRNNAAFLRRNSSIIRKTAGRSPFSCWLSLLMNRVVLKPIRTLARARGR